MDAMRREQRSWARSRPAIAHVGIANHLGRRHGQIEYAALGQVCPGCALVNVDDGTSSLVGDLGAQAVRGAQRDDAADVPSRPVVALADAQRARKPSAR